ncbi:MAG: type II toxin-antitoxin system HicA family toxin [Lachnospiraceae bacterium]|nr:type II toxin-antitoxin system HicA family toxin [Lachnospiraceae bacterium]
MYWRNWPARSGKIWRSRISIGSAGSIRCWRSDALKISELIKILKCNDCFFVEHGAEHDKWHSARTGKDIRVPRHGSKEIPIGTLNRILKDAGIRR